MIVPTVFIDTSRELPAEARERLERRYGADALEAAAIAVALPVAIAMARQRGWSSERTFREAEAYAVRR
jgi:hypothetical protein